MIEVRLEFFEGPFDLLFHLIEKNEIDIYDIPISSLTEQYMEHIKLLKNIDMDSMSQFMLMAATLIEIKSKMLIPIHNKDEESVDPREELVNRLIEYKRFKEITSSLKEFETVGEKFVYREPEKEIINLFSKERLPEVSQLLEEVTLDNLFSIFENVLKRKELKVDKIRSGFSSIKRDLYTLEDKIDYIKNLLVISGKVAFKSMFKKDSDKLEKVVTFLAMLELIKAKYIEVVQDDTFDEIYVYKRERS